MILVYLGMLETEEQKKKFEQIYRDHLSLMLYTANKVTSDKQLAEDAVHETFLNIIRTIDTIRTENCNELASLIVIMTRNKTIDMFKCKKEIPVDTDQTHIYDSEETESAEETVIATSEIDALMDIVDKLKDEYRTPLLYRAHGYTMAEIGVLMGISESNVKVRIHRGRARAKRLLEERRCEV